MYGIYILKSLVSKRYYIGYAGNVKSRLARHNSGLVKSTKNGAPWRVIYTEIFDTKQEAFKRERQIKSYKGGEAFKKLISDKSRVGTEVVKRD